MSGDRPIIRSRRGVTLLEAVLVVLVLAIAVPASMSMIAAGNENRRQSADVARAITLASCVAEQIIADATSTEASLGFDAFTDEAAYLGTPVSGLYDRLGPMTAVYSDAGMTYTVSIGEMATAEGVVTGDPDQDVFREIVITVSFDDPDGNALSMPVSILLTELAS
ncbi:MAG: hypothetical protein RIB32_00715 [Phycisphaerales bacterium]